LCIGKENTHDWAGLTLASHIAIYPGLEIKDKLKLLESIANRCPEVMSLRIGRENTEGWAGHTLTTRIVANTRLEIEDKLQLFESIAKNSPGVMSLRIGKENTEGEAGLTLTSYIAIYPDLEIEDKLKLLKKIYQFDSNVFELYIGEENGKYAGFTLLPFIMAYEQLGHINRRQLIYAILDEYPNLVRETPDWDERTVDIFLNLGLEISTGDEQYLRNFIAPPLNHRLKRSKLIF